MTTEYGCAETVTLDLLMERASVRSVRWCLLEVGISTEWNSDEGAWCDSSGDIVLREQDDGVSIMLAEQAEVVVADLTNISGVCAEIVEWGRAVRWSADVGREWWAATGDRLCRELSADWWGVRMEQCGDGWIIRSDWDNWGNDYRWEGGRFSITIEYRVDCWWLGAEVETEDTVWEHCVAVGGEDTVDNFMVRVGSWIERAYEQYSAYCLENMEEVA